MGKNPNIAFSRRVYFPLQPGLPTGRFFAYLMSFSRLYSVWIPYVLQSPGAHNSPRQTRGAAIFVPLPHKNFPDF